MLNLTINIKFCESKKTRSFLIFRGSNFFQMLSNENNNDLLLCFIQFKYWPLALYLALKTLFQVNMTYFIQTWLCLWNWLTISYIGEGLHVNFNKSESIKNDRLSSSSGHLKILPMDVKMMSRRFLDHNLPFLFYKPKKRHTSALKDWAIFSCSQVRLVPFWH